MITGMKAFLISLLCFFSAVSAQKILFRSLNEKCRDGTEPWICRKLSSCSELAGGIKNGTVEICSFSGDEPVVCCPPASKPANLTTDAISNLTKSDDTSSASGRKAELKCREYAQYVYRTIENPLLLTGAKKLKIDKCAMPKGDQSDQGVVVNEFPHMALLGMYTQSGYIGWFCGGSLISPRFILTAAHCDVREKLDVAMARLGDLDITDERDRSRSVDVKIAAVYDHPEYRPSQGYHDIALLKMDRDVPLGPGLRPICLQASGGIDGERAVVAGWGFNTVHGYGQTTSTLRKITLDLRDDENCTISYSSRKPDGIKRDIMICAGGEPGKDKCQGDSGGPLQIAKKDVYCTYSQIGVWSFGAGCGTGVPGVYTRVSRYVPWIESIVWP